MSVTRASIIKGFHESYRTAGDKRVASDYSLEIEGFADAWLYCKSQFWPVLTPGEGIEDATPLGSAMWQPSQTKFHQQAQITFIENSIGTVNKLFEDLLFAASDGFPGGKRFNAWVYYGTPGAGNFKQCAQICDAFMTVEPLEVDWENRTQLVTFPATIFYHFYGKYEGPKVKGQGGGGGGWSAQ